jgi:hypothetical protein
MEIKDILIDNSENLCKFFKDNKIKYRKYSQEKCYILKMNSDDIVDEWHRNLRGVVYNYEEKKILVLPPPKSREINGYMREDVKFTELFDGTMINIFYNNDKWNMSSRSTIGCNNRWIEKKTYKKLFEETHCIDYESLNKNYSYSFVLRNRSNRNISFIDTDEIILVRVYDTVNNCDIELNETHGFKIPVVYDTMGDIDITDCRIKGFTYTEDNKRYKWLTLPFKEMKKLKLNVNDKSLMYFELRKNHNLKEYLHYFPEDSKCFSQIRDFFHDLKNKLYQIYYSVNVKKEISFKDINYEYKPLIKEIHQLYLLSGTKIRLTTVEEYLHNLPSKRLVFVMNFSK